MVAAGTPGPHTDEQLTIATIVLAELQRRQLPLRPPAQVPPPPVQLPPLADDVYSLIVTALTGAQQTTEEPNPCAAPTISMSSSVDPGTALVGDSVDFTFTVRNPGTVSLTDVQVASALPDGLEFVSASSGGAVDADTGYVQWAIATGLAPGASTELSVSATIANSGEWTNNSCTGGLDAIGNVAKDCASATVLGAALTVTPTVTTTPTAAATRTATVTPTAAPTRTATLTPTVPPTQTARVTPTVPPTETPTVVATDTPEPAQPIATPPEENLVEPTDTPPPEPAQVESVEPATPEAPAPAPAPSP